ncbi:MAG: hypothetical protein JW781_02670, partial [Deltaproteobacteria bacterium]|nr:hypothetical protein [Candidatus Anaeroferrophillacea bacterium]
MPLSLSLGCNMVAGGGGAAAYYVNDVFSSGDASSPRTCTPGPGTLTITDTAGGSLAVGSGVLTISGSGTYGETVVTGPAITRANGLRFELDINAPLNAMFFVGLQSSASPASAPNTATVEYATKWDSVETIDIIVNGVEVSSDVQSWAASTQYRLRFQLKAAGCTISISGGAFGALGEAWTELYDTSTGSDATLYPVINARLSPTVT